MAGKDKLDKITTIRWPIDLYERIEREAQKKGLRTATYVRMVVMEHLDKKEDV